MGAVAEESDADTIQREDMRTTTSAQDRPVRIISISSSDRARAWQGERTG